ncbi:helix-turn-helix domain-containing protein [Curtobacterium sp. TXMA1]|uniref:helix-turn-helix domain-containing protein n=1 Tax=Curtobacterium sp. TXMA1 TaxID=2876939 RepID=UPI001CCAF13D|nr:helix-turn-helix transcriptional regulator [Curtobacterium sp. TXMA1]UBQ01255.1 helix-turn-helix domain-containing protein [Curtobacterium sp. TXMA1]
MVRLPLSPDELERGRRLGALLRSARDDRSILDVALAAGISPETLRKIETGRIATPSFASIAAVAGVVGLSLDTLWAEVHPPSPTGSTDGGPSGARVGAVRG